MQEGGHLVVTVNGRRYARIKRDRGPELPSDRDRREASKRELERQIRQPISKALGLSNEDFGSVVRLPKPSRHTSPSIRPRIPAWQ